MSTAPPAWYPDPTGSHEFRYWDGQSWTPHVSDQGQTGISPLPQREDETSNEGDSRVGTRELHPSEQIVDRSAADEATEKPLPAREPAPTEDAGEETTDRRRDEQAERVAREQGRPSKPSQSSTDEPTERVSPLQRLMGGLRSPSQGSTPDRTEQAVSAHPESPALKTSSPWLAQFPEEPTKITQFNAKKVAQQLVSERAELIHEVQRCHALLEDLKGLDAGEHARLTAKYRAEAERARGEAAARRAELSELSRLVVVNRERLELEEFGLFDYEHVAEASTKLATELEALRSRIRQSNKIGTAISASQNFTFNNSTSKGKTFVNQMSRIMLRAYNAEAENAVKTVKAGNLGAAQRRLSKAREQIAKQGQLIQLNVENTYHHLRLQELELAARHLQAKAREREEERERREALREQRKLEEEIRREKERLEKERTHYLNSIQKLLNRGDQEGAEKLRAQLDRIDKEIADADYRAANIRAGYVYVISNIGAFGEDVVKIGMTRRLNPMDRIRELGDASVPFNFDIHALFFSDDAVGIEAMLHREFAGERLNKINTRREYFRVQPKQVLDALQEHNVSVLEFTTHAAADDYRMSWPDGYPTGRDSGALTTN